MSSFLDKELEDSLIHFTHGRDTWGEKDVPSSHKKKSFKQYADNFEPGYSEKARSAWRELCQYTHPSASSVVAFMQFDVTEDTPGSKWLIGKDYDYLQILYFTYKYRNLLSEMCDEFLLHTLIIQNQLNKFKYSRSFRPKLGIVMSKSD